MRNSKRTRIKVALTIAIAVFVCAVLGVQKVSSAEPKTYTVSYNANGGEGAPETQKKVHNVPLTLSEQIPTREGYEFLGWSTTVNPEVRYQAGDVYTENHGAKFYAIWRVNEFTVSFNGNGSEYSFSDMKKIRDIPLQLPYTIPTLKGYVFQGWSTTVNPEIRYQPGDLYTENHGAKFYAIWKRAESGCNEVFFNGNRNDRLITEQLCYYEGEKFYLFLDKGLDLPGDFANNVALIIDALEENLALSFLDSPEDWYPGHFSLSYYRYDPWTDIEYGKKYPIFIHREPVNGEAGAQANGRGAEITVSTLSVDEYDEVLDCYIPTGYVDYYTIAHELTHALTTRYSEMTNIMLEGSASYIGGQVVHDLSDINMDFWASAAAKDRSDLGGGKKATFEVSTDNMENVFVTDCKAYSESRDDCYIIGRYLCQFLEQTYGNSYLHDFIVVLNGEGFDMNHIGSTNVERELYVECFETLFGDDVFADFAVWYQNAIQ